MAVISQTTRRPVIPLSDRTDPIVPRTIHRPYNPEYVTLKHAIILIGMAKGHKPQEIAHLEGLNPGYVERATIRLAKYARKMSKLPQEQWQNWLFTTFPQVPHSIPSKMW